VNQKNKELWVIPSIVTLAWGLVLIPVAAWLTNVPMRTVVTFTGIKNLWFAPVSAWIVLVVLLTAACISYLYWRSHAALNEERAKTQTLETESVSASDTQRQEIMDLINTHQREMNAIRVPAPRLEVVWEESFWGEDTVQGRPAIYLSGWAFFSIHYGSSACVLVQASVNGSETVSIPPIHLGGRSDRKQFFTNVMPPMGTHGEPLQATITFIDTRNRRYVLLERTFQWSSSPGDN
jgi:hypothetical protein